MEIRTNLSGNYWEQNLDLLYFWRFFCRLSYKIYILTTTMLKNEQTECIYLLHSNRFIWNAPASKRFYPSMCSILSWRTSVLVCTFDSRFISGFADVQGWIWLTRFRTVELLGGPNDMSLIWAFVATELIYREFYTYWIFGGILLL